MYRLCFEPLVNLGNVECTMPEFSKVTADAMLNQLLTLDTSVVYRWLELVI